MSEAQSNAILFDRDSGLNEGIALTIYFVLKPIYLFSSGLPQISDMFLMTAVVYMLFKERGQILISHKYSRWICIFISTLVFQVIAQGIWWLKTRDNEMILKAAYYVFNFIAVLLCINIGQHIGTDKLKLTVCKGCFYSVIVTAVGLVLSGNSGIRSTGFFNNPNQLGYYALLIFTIIVLFPDQLPRWQNIVIIVITLWANIVSLSKASVIGFVGLLICYTLWGSKEKTQKRAQFQVLFLILIFVTIFWFLYSNSSLILKNTTLLDLRNRLLNMSTENDSSLGIGRGYDRVKELGVHFMWGVGEGAYGRFKVKPGYEVHSTFVNILVSYGIIGLLAYVWLITKPILSGKESVRNLACFSGIFLYSVTHNGVRNTLLWILLGTVLQVNATLEYGEIL